MISHIYAIFGANAIFLGVQVPEDRTKSEDNTSENYIFHKKTKVKKCYFMSLKVIFVIFIVILLLYLIYQLEGFKNSKKETLNQTETDFTYDQTHIQMDN